MVCKIKNTIIGIIELFINVCAISTISRWPAIILALNRIDKVKGRIIFLIVSIITIKGIKNIGVLLGIKWINVFSVFFFHIKKKQANHKGKANVIEKDMCLEAVKI